MGKDLAVYKNKAIVLTMQEEQVDTDLYKTELIEIEISMDDFWCMYPGYSPKKALVEKIASAMGIEFYNNSTMEDKFGDITKYPDGREVRKVEGYLCTKQGKRRRFDGTFEDSASKEYLFNWANRTELDILADEEKEKSKQKYTFSDPVKQKRMRRICYESNKKFAAQRASTGAELNVIKYFAALPSFKEKDIKLGLIVVSQIVLSKGHQKMAALANLEAIKDGKTSDKINENAALLTGNTPDVQKDVTQKTEPKIAPVKAEDKPEGEKPFIPVDSDFCFDDILNSLNSGDLPLIEAYKIIIELPEVKAIEGIQIGIDEVERWKRKDGAISSFIHQVKGMLNQ